MKTLIKQFSLLLVALTFSFNALALTLQDAKAQGKVGEQPSGYLGLVVDNAQVQALVKQVNGKRKQIYLKLARKHKVSVAQIAARAGEKALKKTQAGHYIKNAAGQWVKK
jgi:uncharacterized protein YdbL (DUF1318 family)